METERDNREKDRERVFFSFFFPSLVLSVFHVSFFFFSFFSRLSPRSPFYSPSTYQCSSPWRFLAPPLSPFCGFTQLNPLQLAPPQLGPRSNRPVPCKKGTLLGWEGEGKEEKKISAQLHGCGKQGSPSKIASRVYVR